MRRLFAALTSAVLTLPLMAAPSPGPFELVATYQVSGEVAEIAAVTPDGKILVYTDSEENEIGFVSLVNPSNPFEIGTLSVDGSPTSVAITPDGRYGMAVISGDPSYLAVISMKNRQVVREIGLGGQPDAIAVSADGRFAAITIENEREDGEADMPDGAAGFLTIVNLNGPVRSWSTRDVSLTGYGRFDTDPEPEFVAINQGNIAAVTLQENNHIVLVNLTSGSIVGDFSAGTTTHAADLTDNGDVSFTETLSNARREPDGISWTFDGNLVTANEGDYSNDLEDGEFVGGRDFTIFTPDGEVLYEPGASLEESAQAEGLYPDSRSDARGTEPEGVAVGLFDGRKFLFVGAERGGFLAIYSLENESNPELLQILETGDRPEGLVAIPNRKLFVTANEDDGDISIFRYVN